MADCCYLCSECNISFSSLSQLEEHLLCHAETFLTHHQGTVKEEPMMDEDASSQQHSPSSSDSVDMKDADMGKDVDLGLNTCKFCAHTFDHRTELSLHLSTLHTDRPLYHCQQCPLVFAVKRDLSTHARVHSGEDPHECAQCGKQFGTRQLLKKHCMWHTGERSHVCPHCSKAFFQKGHLTQHLMIHAGGRPHVCNLCSKTFIFKFDLNRHMKIHSERGHSCMKCRRSFLKQSSLDDHVAKCKGIQSRSFSSTPSTPTTPSSTLLTLQKPVPLTPTSTSSLMTSSPMYSCMLCGQSNGSTSDLALHLAIAHFPSAPLPQISSHSSPLKMDLDSPLSIGLSTPTKLSDGLSAFFPIKTEEITTVDTATNSSCASSPQKASPMGSTSSPSMDREETPPLSFPSPPSKCACDDKDNRIAELESLLASTQNQLNTSNALLAFRMKNDMTPPPPLNFFSTLASLSRTPSIPSFISPSNLQSLLVNLQ